MRWLVLVSALLMTLPCLSDGLPIDDSGMVYGDHVVLMLSPLQIVEIGRSRALTLEGDQLETMRKLVPEFPGQVRIFTPSYDDCMCGVVVYGIWTRPEQVAIPYGKMLKNPDVLTGELRFHRLPPPEPPRSRKGARFWLMSREPCTSQASGLMSRMSGRPRVHRGGTGRRLLENDLSQSAAALG